MRRLARFVPDRFARPAARYAVPIAAVAVLLVAGMVVAGASLVAPGAFGITAARLSETTALPETLLTGDLAARDSDLDGVSDSLENYLYGTDPENWDSSGTGIPDGWLVQFGYDPLSPLLSEARGRAPSPSTLPAAYADGYPLAYTPTLAQYYAYGKPAGYQPGVDTPWWRGSAPHADPGRVDQTGSGVPTGWMLHYGLDVADANVDKVAPGSRGNLTIRQAFEHNTNPLAADSDRDGVEDWVEIHVTGTDPSRLSTAGTGIADGWLLRYELDPFGREVASQDADRDGLTNREEFLVSLDTFRDEVDAQGIAVLFEKGLDPMGWQTAGTGIPDGWYVKYGLSPFTADADAVIGRASDWPEVRDLESAPEGYEPKPDLVMTVRDAYEYGRPADWNETLHGVWWGGTNPATLDTDEDGIPDPVEIRGWYANATYDLGPTATARVYNATGNPLEADSDGDGLSDVEEYRGVARCDDGTTREFPPTDPRNRDTAFSGLTDREKVCGIVRGPYRYDLNAEGLRLDPTKVDSAGDYLRDGAALDFWHERFTDLTANPRYPYEGSKYRTLSEWTGSVPRFSSLSPTEVLAEFRPDGDVDNDGIPNLIDRDPSGGLYAAMLNEPDRAKVYFPGGPQIDPSLYRFTEFASDVPHARSDPANPDTDGDGLPDFWETQYGVFDAAMGGWNLDPSKADSDGDGVFDDEANNDGDSVVWYAYNRRGASIERVTNEFEFNNRLEFLAETDPNQVSTMGDGISDAWKAFWGSRVSTSTFPSLLGAREPSVGDLAIERASAIETAMANSPIQPLARLAGADALMTGAKSTGYVRFLNVTSCDAAAATLPDELGETESLPSEFCYSGQNLEGSDVRIARVQGVWELSFKSEADLRTNPFLADTDGDGASDAYEAYYMQRGGGGTAYPDPVAHDPLKDLDAGGEGDGLTLVDECASLDGGDRCGHHLFPYNGATYGAGSDPQRVDSDGDGIADGIEYNAGLDPLNPADVEGFRDPTRDTDGDGVPDYQELTGWGKIEFGISVRTDPNDPDSDGDGLLDGPSQTLDPSNAAHATRIEAWKELGVAHRTRSDGRVDFLGERTFGTSFGFDPTKQVSSGSGVPDGWLAYYNQNPNENAPDVEAYQAFRPEWWDEEAHGVWWWGRAPGTAAVSQPDLDADGLHDANGEDPFPATLRLNLIQDGSVNLTNPAQVESWVTGAPTAEEERRRAQLVGDGAGDPTGARLAAQAAVDDNGVFTRLDRARVAILDVQAPASLTKGEPFQVTGRVVLDERTSSGALLEGDESNRVGVANRTVLVSLFRPSPDTLVGAGFTEPDGTFNLTASIAPSLVQDIPYDGITLLGITSGTATTELDPSLVTVGTTTGGQANRLVVWVTNTSATVPPGHPTYGEHQAILPDAQNVPAQRVTHATRFAVSDPQPVVVYSDTRFTSTLPPSVANGDELSGDLRLEDASGAPLSDREVRVRWFGSTSVVTVDGLFTNRNGVVNLTERHLRASVPTAGAYALRATFVSDDPYLRGVETDFDIDVRDPTRLDASLDRDSATVGEDLRVSGHLVRTSVTLADGTVTASHGLAGEEIVIRVGGIDFRATTDPQGRFSERILVPGTLGAGDQMLEVRYEGSSTAQAARALLPLSVKRTSDIVGLNTLEGPRTIDATLRGRLVDNQGQGFAGELRIARENGALLATARADDRGEFAVAVPLRALDLGTQPLRVSYAGDATHAPAQNLTTARITTTTRILVESAPTTLTRGQPVELVARLVDDAGAPVRAQPIQVFWRGESLAHLMSGEDGTVRYAIPTNASAPLGEAEVGFTFQPHAGSFLQPASAAATLDVRAGTLLELPSRDVARGLVGISGRLLDDDGRPLQARTVAVRLDGALLGQAVTSRNGSFSLDHAFAPDHPLGRVQVEASFAGGDRLAPAAANATWRVQSPLRLTLAEAGPFVRGEAAPLVGTLHDDAGRPVDLPLDAVFDGQPLVTVRPTVGALDARVPVPAETERGEHHLVLSWPGDDRYPPLERNLTIQVKVRPTVEVDLPRVAVRGFSIGGDVTLKDDRGEPLRNTTFVYAMGGSGQDALLATTDEEGRARLASVAPLTGGDAFFALTVRGGGDVVPTEYRTESLQVIGPATPVGYASLVLAVLVLLGVAALVVVAVVLRRRQIAEVREILEDAINELVAGNEYAGTIFLAYRRLVAHVARHGFVEKETDTPREVATGIRRAVPIGTKSLGQLIRLFEEARYSDHPIGSSERDRAIESLSGVRNELDVILGRKEVAQ